MSQGFGLPRSSPQVQHPEPAPGTDPALGVGRKEGDLTVGIQTGLWAGTVYTVGNPRVPTEAAGVDRAVSCTCTGNRRLAEENKRIYAS